MSYAEICDAVSRLRVKYQENDPFKLCKLMGINLIMLRLGNDPDSIKGFFLEEKRARAIIVNEDLPLIIQKIIVMHELGHAILHRSRSVYAFPDVIMFDSTSVMEKEANLFAAEFLLDDDIVLNTLNQDNTFFTAASELMVPMELLDFKFRVLKWRGYKLTESPVTVRSNFLRDLEVPNNDDNYCC